MKKETSLHHLVQQQKKEVTSLLQAYRVESDKVVRECDHLNELLEVAKRECDERMKSELLAFLAEWREGVEVGQNALRCLLDVAGGAIQLDKSDFLAKIVAKCKRKKEADLSDDSSSSTGTPPRTRNISKNDEANKNVANLPSKFQIALANKLLSETLNFEHEGGGIGDKSDIGDSSDDENEEVDSDDDDAITAHIEIDGTIVGLLNEAKKGEFLSFSNSGKASIREKEQEAFEQYFCGGAKAGTGTGGGEATTLASNSNTPTRAGRRTSTFLLVDDEDAPSTPTAAAAAAAAASTASTTPQPPPTVIETFSCAYQQATVSTIPLVHGRLFVTSESLHFIGWGKLKVEINFQDVESVDSRGRLSIGIRMRGKEKENLFSSFAHRENCLQLVQRCVVVRKEVSERSEASGSGYIHPHSLLS